MERGGEGRDGEERKGERRSGEERKGEEGRREKLVSVGRDLQVWSTVTNALSLIDQMLSIGPVEHKLL